MKSKEENSKTFVPITSKNLASEQNIIFLNEIFFLLVPIAQQPGQGVVLGRMSVCLCFLPQCVSL
jgi:hypothetical protein